MKIFRSLSAVTIAILALVFLGVGQARAADTYLTICSPLGASGAGTTVLTRSGSTYTADSNGCISFDVTKDVNGTDLLAQLRAGWVVQTMGRPVIGLGISPNTTGVKFQRYATAGCTTAASVGATCAEPTQTFSPGFADTSYTAVAWCAAVSAGIPVAYAGVKASNTIITDIAALTAASASCSEVDVMAIHD